MNRTRTVNSNPNKTRLNVHVRRTKDSKVELPFLTQVTAPENPRLTDGQTPRFGQPGPVGPTTPKRFWTFPEVQQRQLRGKATSGNPWSNLVKVGQTWSNWAHEAHDLQT